MADALFGVNSLQVAGGEYLLAVSTSAVVHLVAALPAGSGGQSAVDGYLFDDRATGPSLSRRYDRAALIAPRWAPVTLCGVDWSVMVGGDGGPTVDGDLCAYAPTCRRCLARMDRLFPPPQAADGLDRVVERVSVLVAEGGYAEIVGVPGDQQPALRRLVRAEVRRRTGHGSQTIVKGSLVVVVCEAVYRQRADRDGYTGLDAAVRRLGDGPAQPPAWRLAWDRARLP